MFKRLPFARSPRNISTAFVARNPVKWTWLFLVLFSLGKEASSDVTTENTSATSIKPKEAYPPTDVKGTFTVVYQPRRIIFSLTWKPPILTDKKVLKNYHIFIHVPSDESAQCRNQFSFITEDISPNKTFFEVPHEEHNHDIKVIHFGCTYSVKLSSFIHRDKKQYDVIYNFTVPKCLKGNCLCEAPLPPPNDINVNASTIEAAVISWKYPLGSFNISHFKVKLGVYQDAQRRYKPFKEMYVNYSDAEYFEAKMNITEHKKFRIMVHTVDDIFCERSNASILIDCSSNSCFCTAPILNSPPQNVTVHLEHKGKSMIAAISWSYPNTSIPYVEAFSLEMNGQQIHTNNSKVDSPVSGVSYFKYSQICDPPKSYKILIRPISDQFCYGPPSKEFFYKCTDILENKKENNITTAITVIIIVLCVIISLVLVGSAVKRYLNFGIFFPTRKKKESLHGSMCSDMSRGTRLTYLTLDHEHTNEIYVPLEIEEARQKGLADHYEILYCRLTLGKEIGRGAFGRVCMATAEAIAGIPGKMTVAVKQLREGAEELERKDFLAEISMMKKVGRHPNVVTMLGCCTLQQPYCMVMEYVPCGDLHRYLKKLRDQYEKRSRPNTCLSSTLSDDSIPWNNISGMCSFNSDSIQPLLPYHKCSIASDNYPPKDYIVAAQSSKEEEQKKEEEERTEDDDDQCFLSSIDNAVEPTCNYIKKKQLHQYLFGSYTPLSKTPKIEYSIDAKEMHSFASQVAAGMNHLTRNGITHRDLATRNVLVNQDKQLKISDFGLSRTGIYVTKNGGRVPLRWLSIEAISKYLYSEKSDVWAFGIVLWEICTLGGFPYASIADTAVLPYLLDGNRLEKPANCSDEFYEIMKSCWVEDPEYRPTFTDLEIQLEKMKADPRVYVHFDANGETPLPPSETDLESRSNEVKDENENEEI